jgi:hypothetical protein
MHGFSLAAILTPHSFGINSLLNHTRSMSLPDLDLQYDQDAAVLPITQRKYFNTEDTVVWVVAPCSLAEFYRRFRGSCCLYRQDVDDGEGSKRFLNSVNLYEFTRGNSSGKMPFSYSPP